MKAPTPPRQKFIDHLNLRQLAQRTVQSHTEWIVLLAKFHHRSPDEFGNPQISSWLLHLISQRKLSASTVNVVINALRSFYGAFLKREVESLLAGIKRPHLGRLDPSGASPASGAGRCGGPGRPVNHPRFSDSS